MAKAMRQDLGDMLDALPL
jgi:hypothetical protein